MSWTFGLPGMTGLDLQEKLLLSGRVCPVIFMTAHDNPEWQERAIKAGAIAYLKKPFPEQALLDAIQAAASPVLHPEEQIIATGK